jgi:hypothetical protein
MMARIRTRSGEMPQIKEVRIETRIKAFRVTKARDEGVTQTRWMATKELSSPNTEHLSD